METLLVVEDEILLLFTLQDDLRAAGYVVLAAPNADEAIDVLERHPETACMITDIDMPGSMDGIHLAAKVRDRWPQIKIVLTSGHKRPASSELPDGAFIEKPYRVVHLLETIGKIC